MLRFTIIFAGILLLLVYPVKAQSSANGGSPDSPEPDSSGLDSPGLDSPGLDSLERLRSTPPRFDILRAREDFSYLAEGSIRHDFFDPIKYISWGASGDWYLTLGGEIRQQYQWFINEGWGALPEAIEDHNGHWLQRYMLHANLQLGKHVRLFGQLKNGTIVGRKGGPRPQIDQDELGIHQGFIDLTGTLGPSTLTLRVGRQEFFYGAERMITMREGPNVRLSFDAIKFIAEWPKTKIDALVARPVLINPYVFDDEHAPRETMWAVYSVHYLTATRSNLDLYYIGQERLNAAYNQGVAYELRHTAGARFWEQDGPFKYNIELIGQLGEFGNGDIQAFYVASEIAYVFPGAWKPTLQLTNNLISGDNDPTDPNLQTFNPMYPRPFFGLAAPIGPSNLMDIHPEILFTPAEAMSLSVGADFLWRYSTRDGIYSPAVMQSRPQPPPPPERASDQIVLLDSEDRYTGVQFTLSYLYQFTPHWTFMLDGAFFPAGPFIRETGVGNDLFYLAPQLTFKF